MQFHLSRFALSTGLCAALISSTALAETTLPSAEEMWRVIQQQQAEIQALKSQLNQTDKKLEATDQKVEATGEAVQQVQASGTSTSGGSSAGGWWDRTSIGGYGEMHYNGLRDNQDDQLDFHRFVLFINHDFTDRIRLFTELELEHSLAGDNQPGEVELEQAYVEFDLTQNHHAKAGLFLMPVGILNEHHEPNTFFGVERNPVEKNIIPTTWWEGGVGLGGHFAEGFSYDVAVHSGLNVDSTFNIRSGRQKVAQADADKGAITGRIKYSGIPGVTLASSLQYQQDITQDDTVEGAEATLFEAHADILKQGFGFRALYARWDIDGMAAAALGRDEQYGWYVEPSYRFDIGNLGELGIFARYNEYDNAAGDSTDSKYTQIDLGTNYWPHPDVVLKADMAFQEMPNNQEDEILNLGVGFQF